MLPANDSKTHVEKGENCHCRPRVAREGGDVVVVHNAYDGREFYEAYEVAGDVVMANQWSLKRLGCQ